MGCVCQGAGPWQSSAGAKPPEKYIHWQEKIKCRGETEILHEKVHDTTRKSENHELLCAVS